MPKVAVQYIQTDSQDSPVGSPPQSPNKRRPVDACRNRSLMLWFLLLQSLGIAIYGAVNAVDTAGISRAAPAAAPAAVPALPSDAGSKGRNLSGGPAAAASVPASIQEVVSRGGPTRAWRDLNRCTLEDATLGGWRPPVNHSPTAFDYLVLIFGNKDAVGRNGKYFFNRQLWECYQDKMGVAVRFLDPACFTKCTRTPMIYMKRLCAMGQLLDGFLEKGTSLASDLGLAKVPKWIFHMDGDTVMVNHHMDLASITRTWTQEVVFYERFHNAEIMAGNYAVQVTSTALSFLRGWFELEPLLGRARYHNADNGLLHFQVLNFLGDERPVEQNRSYLMEAWTHAADVQGYDRFVARFKLALGPQRVFRRLLIQRRGLGFCADDITNMFTSQSCHHAIKNTKQLLNEAQGNQTCMDRSLQCLQSFSDCVQSDLSKLQNFMRSWPPDRGGHGNVNDIADCWPNCTANISEDVWTRMAQGLEEAGTLPGSAWRRPNDYRSFQKLLRPQTR